MARAARWQMKKRMTVGTDEGNPLDRKPCRSCHFERCITEGSAQPKMQRADFARAGTG
jgi:hypothetical protein